MIIIKKASKLEKLAKQVAHLPKGRGLPESQPKGSKSSPLTGALSSTVRKGPNERWYINLGGASHKGCSLFLAEPTKKGFIPTRDGLGAVNKDCNELLPNSENEVPVKFEKGNPTSDGYRAWVAERKEGKCVTLPLSAALKRGLVKVVNASVDGNATKVYLPNWWKPGQKLPLYVGLECPAGRVETFTHKVKRADGKPRNYEVHAKVSLT